MKRLVSFGLAAAAVVAVVALAPAVPSAQEGQAWPPPEALNPQPLSVNCAGGTYLTGGGASLFQLCVSDHGNMTQLQYPAGAEHIGIAPVSEAYGVCHGPTSNVWYYDFANFEAGFGPAVIVDPAPFPITIRRTSVDGLVVLDQKFTPNKLRREMTILMTVTNNSATQTLQNVQVSRAVDTKMDNDDPDDIFDRSTEQTWARDIRSLTLSALTVPISHATIVHVPYGTGPCASGGGVATPTAPGNYMMRIWYNLGNILPGKNKKVTFRYGGL